MALPGGAAWRRCLAQLWLSTAVTRHLCFFASLPTPNHRLAGPVDGPALFEGCSNCQVAVAAHLFKANACSTCEFGE